MSLIICVKVVPSSGRQAWTIDKSGTLKCFLKSPAERGLANHELVKRLAEAAGVPQASVAIVSGQTSRSKRVKIEAPLTFEALLYRLGLELQQSLIPKK